MAFTPFQLLAANDLNLALARKADLGTTATQTFLGPINLSLLQAGTALSTVDLIASGTVRFTAPDAMIIPVGSTLQRPLPTQFGQLRANRDTGQYEVVLGNGTWGQLTTVAAPTTAATTPSGLAGVTFGGSTSNSIPVSWTKPSVGTPPYLYTLKYRIAGTSNWINWFTDGSDATTQATVSGLLDSSRYEFQLSARNTAGIATSPITASSTLGFQTAGSTLIATTATSTTVSLAWTGVSIFPVAYQVRYAKLGVSTWSTFGPPTSDLSMTVSGLDPNQMYVFQVQAKNTSGSFESNSVQMATLSAASVAPNAASNLSFPSTTINSITIQWQPPTGGTGPFAYQIMYQIAGATGFTAYKTPTTDTTMNVQGLDSATNYLFHVVAINSIGTSTSANGSATTLSAAPPQGGIAEYQSTKMLPLISGPVLGAVQAGGALDQMGVMLDDPPAAYSLGSMLISAACGSGTVTMTSGGNPIAGSGTNTISNYATTLGGAIAALASLTYTASNLGGSDSIRITVTDQLTLSSTLTININVGSQIPSPTPVPVPGPSPSPGAYYTPSGQPTDADGKQALRSYALTGALGVTTRFELNTYNQGYSQLGAAIVENQINYIGAGGYLRNIRQVCSGNMQASWLAQVAQACGYFNYVLAGGPVAPSLYPIVESNMASLISVYQNGVYGVEGFDPMFDSSNLSAAIQEQSRINNLALANNVFSFQMSPWRDADALTISTSASHSKYGTAKALALPSTPSGPLPPTNDTAGAIHYKLGRASLANGVSPLAIEIGYSAFSDNSTPVPIPGWVSETVQAKYLLEAALDGIPYGALVWLHELQDGDQTYGLFRNDGSPKPAAQALRVMYQLMSDPSSNYRNFFAGKLNYTISGSVPQYSTFANTGLRQLLFQAGTGEFYLWLWNETPLNDSSTNATVTPANVTITLNFVETAMNTVAIYDPFTATTFGGDPQPYVTYQNPSSVPISLPPYPVCVVIWHP